MSRTQGQLQADLGHPDGQIFVSALDGTLIGAGTGTPTRNAAGSFSLNIGASQTAVLSIPISSAIFRYGQQDWLQEQFGSGLYGGAQGLPVKGYTTTLTTSATAGTNVSLVVANSANFTVGRFVYVGSSGIGGTITSIPDATHIVINSLSANVTAPALVSENAFTTPAGVTGTPPFTGTTQLTPVTSPRPKGIMIREIYPVYSLSGAAATLNTIGLTQTTFSPNAVPVVTNILANAANGLATATNAQPYLTPISISSPSYLTTKFSEFVIEWDVTTAAGGAANLFGVFLDVAFNYN